MDINGQISSIFLNKYVISIFIVQVLVTSIIVFIINNYPLLGSFIILTIMIMYFFSNYIKKGKDMFYKAFSIRLFNRFVLKTFDKDIFNLDYEIKGKKYSLFLRKLDTDKRILLITNNVDEDVTDIVLKYFGPFYNINYSFLSPKLLGYDWLKFEFSDGTNIKVVYEEIINLETMLLL